MIVGGLPGSIERRGEIQAPRRQKTRMLSPPQTRQSWLRKETLRSIQSLEAWPTFHSRRTFRIGSKAMCGTDAELQFPCSLQPHDASQVLRRSVVHSFADGAGDIRSQQEKMSCIRRLPAAKAHTIGAYLC